jgi:hypothetical protein
MKNFVNAGQWVLALGGAFAVAGLILASHPRIEIPFLLLIYVWAAIGIKALSSWILSRKFPISSAELRRRKKDFYDGLPR